LKPAELELLKHGRHFRLESGARVVVGRNEAENRRLEELAREGDAVCRPTEVTGPVVLLRSRKVTKKDTEIAARICARYCDAGAREKVKFLCAGRELAVKPLKDEEIAGWRVRPPQPEAPAATTPAAPDSKEKADAG